MGERVTPPGPQVNAASMTAATTGMLIWSLEHWAFRGAVPGPVYLFVQLAVPYGLGHLGAHLAYRRARYVREGP